METLVETRLNHALSFKQLVLARAPQKRQVIGDKKYLISCAKDRDLWINLAASGVPVYNHALILNGVLRQEIDWEGKVEQVRLDNV